MTKHSEEVHTMYTDPDTGKPVTGIPDFGALGYEAPLEPLAEARYAGLTMLDEAMAKLSYELGYRTVTASLEVRFKNPAPILKTLYVLGEITEVTQRLVKAKARVVDEKGTILATGTSTLVRQRGSAHK